MHSINNENYINNHNEWKQKTFNFRDLFGKQMRTCVNQWRPILEERSNRGAQYLVNKLTEDAKQGKIKSYYDVEYSDGPCMCDEERCDLYAEMINKKLKEQGIYNYKLEHYFFYGCSDPNAICNVKIIPSRGPFCLF